ncbi:ABC transporter permease [Terrimonas sp. NA20]|uniref:ABC transporter permease n=1 Tax=Terrimonas ginsenosidimutans TaxID=2908004 RepID=A0ABS9L0J0_9BACT|nr:ABC transporter permease [Terrimonas ginsenosidimutans]MCG2618094.1 ABC transporter permease [Terrimonas ginsenosidimutans]
MSLVIATRAEIIKNRRGAAFWMCLIGSAFIPFIYFLIYNLKPERNYDRMAANAWRVHFQEGWQGFSIILLPMFVILTCSLIVQVEYKNNTWKQVFASPLSTGNIFFSKYTGILAMVIFLLIMFNVFLLLAGVLTDVFHPKFSFLETEVGWGNLIRRTVKSFISLLAIVSIQYWLSLRFRNFIVPIAIGLAMLVASMTLMSWEHIDKVPYAFAFLSYAKTSTVSGRFLENHEIYSLLCFVLFTVLGFLDLRFRKERG